MALKELKRIRKEKKLSQAQLSRLTGISRQSINYYESGRTQPSVKNLLILARELKTEVQQLLK